MRTRTRRCATPARDVVVLQLDPTTALLAREGLRAAIWGGTMASDERKTLRLIFDALKVAGGEE